MKKAMHIVSLSLSLALLVSLMLPSAAAIQQESGPSYMAKVAIVTNVNDNGTNLNNDGVGTDNTIYQDLQVSIHTTTQAELQLEAMIGNKAVTITGVPAARSENMKAIFFSASSSTAKYDVVNMAYVDGTATSLYFKNYSETINASSVLKVYLRDTTSNTRDYVMIECFDFTLSNFSNIVAELPADALMGAWAAEEFCPVSTEETDSPTSRTTSNNPRTIEETFWNLGCEETHSITLVSNVTYSKIPANGDEDITYILTVTSKSISCEEDPTHDSSKESALYVTDLALSQACAPYIFITSEHIDGVVRKESLLVGSLSADIGVSFGPLSISLGVPTSADSWRYDIDKTAQYFANPDSAGKYCRSIITELGSNLMLAKVGDHFTVSCTLMDGSGTVQDPALHRGKWSFTLENRGTSQYSDRVIPHNVGISVYKV